MAGIAAAAELDLDQLLWVPGKKKIFVPPRAVTSEDIQAYVTEYVTACMANAGKEFDRWLAERSAYVIKGTSGFYIGDPIIYA